ncbi:MAG: YjgN family protein [Panacagrimonas sp.]
MNAPVAQAYVASATSEQPPEHFEFTGSGGEYFRIWIVNLLLTILTLGIYSAWAKVRRLQYFSRHTRVAGSVFDYHARPMAILIGRLIALGLFTIYSLANAVPGPLLLLVLVLIGVLLPVLLRNSFRFRLHNTSYRGIRFSFRGTVGEAYITFLLFGILTFGTLYLLAPMFHQRIKAYQHGYSWFGRTRFRFDAGIGSFYGVYLMVGLVFFGGLIGAITLFGGALAALAPAFGDKGVEPDAAVIAPIIFGVFALFLGLSLVVGPLFQSRIGNLVWNHTRLGEHRFESRLRFWPLLGIGVSNFVLVALTLGLFMPWAAVRLARYRAECMSLMPAAPLDQFLADTSADVAATGEETAELFDFDVGL